MKPCSVKLDQWVGNVIIHVTTVTDFCLNFTTDNLETICVHLYESPSNHLAESITAWSRGT
jgi:hypothetical protein